MAGPYPGPFDGVLRALSGVLELGNSTSGLDLLISEGDSITGEDKAPSSGEAGGNVTVRAGNADSLLGATQAGGVLTLAGGDGSPGSKFTPAGDPGYISVESNMDFNATYGLDNVFYLLFDESNGPETGAGVGAIYLNSSQSLRFIGENNANDVEIRTGLTEAEKIWLHPLQFLFENFGNIRSAAVFFFDTTTLPADGDTLTMTDGFSPDETFTFRAAATLANEIQIGATTNETILNMADTISADSTMFDAIAVNDLERMRQTIFNHFQLVIVADTASSSATPRMWGTFASASPRTSRFEDEEDYSSDTTQALPSADPGVKDAFGPDKAGIFRGIHTTRSAPQTFYRINRIPTPGRRSTAPRGSARPRSART